VARVHAAFGAPFDLSSPDAAIRAAGVKAVDAALDLAVRVGARTIIVHPSSEPIGDDERDARIEQSRRSIAAIAGKVREAGCRVAIELLPRTCLGRSPEELLHLLEGVEAETAGVCLDTNHVMGDCAPLPDVVRRLGPRLTALHCSDYDGVDEKHWPPLRGAIDWAALLSALRDTGFTGAFHYEAHLDGETPEERLAFLEANYREVMAGGNCG
jgi:sugar phosphate isomerase/epimerase